jgi:hypothetical protein
MSLWSLPPGFLILTTRRMARSWYRDGADIAALMPRLSTYLGRTDPQHTFWYLSAAPELTALAG